MQIKNITNVKEVPNSAGIYYIYNKNKELVYIGQTSNLRKRIQGHMYRMNFYVKLSSGLDFFSYRICPNDCKRFLLEKKEIKKFNPPLNNQIKIEKVVKRHISINPKNHIYILKILEGRKMEVKGHFSPIVNEIIADHLKVSRYKEIEAAKLREKLGHLEEEE